MKKISQDAYVRGVTSIAVEQPKYRTGGDGSDGTCDCIGMGRGGLKRGGAEEIKGMGGTNYATRHTFLNLQKIKSVNQLRKGDILLKTRDKDDPDMRLPDQYRKGGIDYSEKWGETNFTHYGTVTEINPLRITHMTSPTAKVDEKLGNWKYVGQLPWVDYDAEEPEDPTTAWARVIAPSGKTVKMRAKPSTLCRTYWEVPIGAEVIVKEPGDSWTKIRWAGRDGYMMTKFLQAENQEEDRNLYTVIIEHLSTAEADKLIAEYKTATKEAEKG